MSLKELKLKLDQIQYCTKTMRELGNSNDSVDKVLIEGYKKKRRALRQDISILLEHDVLERVKSGL